MQITFNLDTTGYKDKESAHKNFGKICNCTKRVKNIITMDPAQLITHIEKGVSFTPGELTGTLSTDWKSQQIIAADIDNKKDLLDKEGHKVKDDNNKVVQVPCDHIIAPAEALEILHANNLDPYLMYYSFSNTPELPKFRILFVLSEKLTDGKEAKMLTEKIAYLFNCITKEPNADTSVSNLDRVLFGSTPGSVFYKSKTITDKKLLDRLNEPKTKPGKNKQKVPAATPTNSFFDNVNAQKKERLNKDIENFDLLGYILQTKPGSHTHVIGNTTYINPCPVCGHKDDFRIKDNTFWACYGGTTNENTNGSIIDYLMEVENMTLPEALDYFKHAIMKYPTNSKRAHFGVATPTNDKKGPAEPEIVDIIPTDIANATKEQLLDIDFITQVFKTNPPGEAEELKEFLLDRARELNCGCVQRVKTLINRIMKKQRDNEISEKITGYTEFEHKTLNKKLAIGDNYISENGKIYGIKKGKDFDEVYIICPCMVYPLERLCNIENNKERMTITFFKDGKWREQTIDKIMVANHSKVVELANYGLPITSVVAKSFVSFMATVESLNKDIPRIETTNRFGWIKSPAGSMEFVPYSEKVKFDGESENNDISQVIKPHGDKEKWVDLVKQIRNTSNKQFMPQLFMSISLASALLEPLNMLPFIANIWGLTGRGKTAVLKLSTSIWSNPEESKYIMDGDTTATALFVKASILKHLPLCIDDFSKVDLKKLTIENLIYTLCSGTDRARATKEANMREVRTWKNAIITTFERPLIDENMKGGAINRVLDFEIPDVDIFEDPGKVFNTVQNNYGFFGNMFIEKVQEIGAAKLLEIQRDFEEKIKAAAAELGEQKETKQILPLSVILTADKIAAEIFQDGIYLDVKQLTRYLKGTKEVSDGQRAYDYLMNYIAINQRNFINLDNEDLSESHFYNSGYEQFGYLGTEPGTSNKFVFFNSAQLERALKENNYNKKVFLNWLRENQLIKLSKNSFMSTKRILGNVQKVYAVRYLEEKEDPQEEK